MNGDFATLVACHRTELVNYARRLCRSRHAAEDVVQTAMLKAFRAWQDMILPEDGDRDKVIRGWIYRITYNCFVNAYRSAQRRTLQHEQNAIETRLVPPTTEPIRYDQQSDFEPVVEEALVALDRDQRVIVLMATRGASYRDIADHLGCPIGTVMSRLHRARRQLAQLLGDYAAENYGLSKSASGARVDARRKQPAELPETEPDRVDTVVVILADDELCV